MSGRNFVVIPDGLRAGLDGRPLAEPSFVFRSVLDRVVDVASVTDRILLAPANSFGGNVTEHEAAAMYLRGRTRAEIFIPEIRSEHYIDTRGNARLLIEELKTRGMWPLGPIILCSFVYHLPRSLIVFSQEGFEIESSVSATPRYPPERVVKRLWYYSFPPVHLCYEVAAILASIVKII